MSVDVQQLLQEAYEPTAERIIDAALVAYGRLGVTRATVDDIAESAGCARATIYRHFAGRDGLALAVTRREVSRVLGGLGLDLAESGSLSEVLVTSFVEVAQVYAGHEVLGLIVRYEPELLLPAVSGPESPVKRVATEFLVPYVEMFKHEHPLATREPRRFAEWVVRAFLSYLMCPSDFVVLSEAASIRKFVHTYLVPQPATHTDTGDTGNGDHRLRRREA